MDYYEADTEEGLDDQIEETDVPPLPSFPRQSNPPPESPQQPQQTPMTLPIVTDPYYTVDPLLNEDSNEDSDYSLDYEYLGPRHPVYREHNDADSDASELSSNLYDDATTSSSTPFIDATTTTTGTETAPTGFDMWDEDPYSTNDFTWESNDMRLTHFIKAKHRRLLDTDRMAPWNSQTSFWRKEKGWPRQLPYSSTTTNHDQSANALCLVPTNFGLGEQLYGIYRDRIVECGRPWSSFQPSVKPAMKFTRNDKCSTTWLDSDAHHSTDITTTSDGSNLVPYSVDCNSNNSSVSSSSASLPNHISGSSSSSSDGSKFCSTHISISLKRSSSSSTALPPTTTATNASANENDNDSTDSTTTLSIKSASYINKFIPYTKYIKRSDFTPPTGQQHAYLNLGFEPLCLEHKYGYMAIGGLEGEFELYCCMDKDHPVKIWGTKFKGRDNIMLMTNAIQIVRWKRTTSSDSFSDGDGSSSSDNNNKEDDMADDYDYFLLACMNEAGILVYKLPPHQQCLTKQQNYGMKSGNGTTTTAQLYAHLQSFDRLPINDAKVSPDGTKMVCVGDDGFIFMVNIYHHSNPMLSPSHSSESGGSMDMDTGDCTVSFGSPVKLIIPITLLQPTSSPDSTTTTTTTTTDDSSAASSTSSTSSSTPIETEGHAHSFNNNDSGNFSDDIHPSATPYSSQHVVWSHSSEYFAHTSDTHHRVLVWRASTLDILCSIDAAGYTYAIKFHPYLDGVLAFTNRYGYFHTVDLNQVLDRTTMKTDQTASPRHSPSPSVFEFDRQTTTHRGHVCNEYCIKDTKLTTLDSSSPNPHSRHYSAHHTNHLNARHEMTMVAFRGEKDRRLRILAKINGIQWSQDGCYLYVATKKRVLAYEFISWSQQYVHSLFGLAGQKIKQLLEKQHDQQQHEQHHRHQQHQKGHHQERKRKKGGLLRDERKKRQGTPRQSSFFSKSEQSWHQQWSKIPQHIRHQVLNEVNLSTHW